ncbi:MAG: plasmid mobilization relaxosome protein MobC [Lachnospiraceae bacterium]|nr:plasmid mobilization relaxosome protein MobC [Lachnospiraceae bacterium]
MSKEQELELEVMWFWNKIGVNVNQIVKNNNSHVYRESNKINLNKYMEEITGLLKELIMTK